MNNSIFKNYYLNLAFYLLVLFILSIFFLEIKHDVANDSTISEWLINYSGGFTKRGIIGQISIYFARLFEMELRDIILLFQIFILGSYFLLIYFFLKDVIIERLYFLSVFSPIFLLYPVSEIEVLARKEIFIFILFLSHLYVLSNHVLYSKISKLITFSLSVLIWEPIIFFLPLYVFVDFSIKKGEKNLKEVFNELFPYIPGIIFCCVFIFNPLDSFEHGKMSAVLKNEFGEICYMSCGLLKSKSSLIQQFTGNIHAYSFENIFRYILIIIIGFAPLFTLIRFSKLKNKTFIFSFFNQSLFKIFLIILSPISLLFLMGYDWGRWVNITYTLTFITYLFFFKKGIIEIEFSKLKKNLINRLSKKNYVLIFIIYCFTWAPKTTITGDIGSLPLYRAIYKLTKIYLIN